VKYTYGPVPSRRLGLSLGVDVVPRKVCTYNCIYCQVGKTTLHTTERREYIPARSILDDVRESLKDWGDKVDYIAISGSGEPTLNSKLGEIIRGIKEMTSLPVAVLTNGSLLHLDEVRRDLLEADVVMPSLDAVTPQVFHTLNRSHPTLDVKRVIEGLVEFRKEFKGRIWLEILFCRGVNDDWAEIEKLKETIRVIQPDKVQLNTVMRPSVEDFAYPVSPGRMEQIREALGEGAEVISEFEGRGHEVPWPDLEERVIQLIERRPVTPEDLARTLSVHDLEITKILDGLTKQGKIKYRVFNRRLYYEIVRGAEG